MRTDIFRRLQSLFSKTLPGGVKRLFGWPQAALESLSATDSEYGEILRAAQRLRMGEFLFLQAAFYRHFGREMTEAETNHYFRTFILKHQIPWWAREAARSILRDRPSKAA